MKWLKRFLALVAVAAVGGGVVGLILYELGDEGRAVQSIEKMQATEGIPVEVAQPVRRGFTDFLLCDGNVVADVQAMLRAQIDELVEAVHVRVGEPVTKDQLLVEFRKTDLEAAIEAARAAYDQAANNYKRSQNLFEQQLAPAERVEQARTAVESAQAALRQALSRVAFAEIRSPIDGVVEQRWVEPGEYKGVGKELLSVVDLSTVEVRALVPEDEVARLSVGQSGEFQLESGPEWLPGTISRIGPSTQDPNRFFDVYLKADNRQTDGRWLMRPGMYAEVRFVRGVVEDALALPASCVVYEGNAQVAYLVEEGTMSVRRKASDESEAEARPHFLARLGRGWERAKAAPRALLSRLLGAGVPVQEVVVEVEQVEALLARRAEVEVLDRSEGFVQVKGNPLSEGRLVVVNPRDAIHDGTRVQVVGQEGL